MALTNTFRLEWIDPETEETVESVEFPWLDPRYDPQNTGGEAKVKEVVGNAGVVRMVSRPVARRGTLVGGGAIAGEGGTIGGISATADEIARRIVEITRGYDATQEWHRLDVRFRDWRGMTWGVKVKRFDVEIDAGWSGASRFEFEMGVESAPAVFRMPCE